MTNKWFKYGFAVLFLSLLHGVMSLAHADEYTVFDSQLPQWTDDWRPSYGCSINTQVAGVDGNADGVLAQSLPSGFSGGNYSWSRIVPVRTGAVYRFHVYYRLEGVSAAMAQFHFIDANGNYMNYVYYRETSELLSGTTTDWNELTYEITAPEGAAEVRISLRLNSSGTVLWDAPSFTTASILISSDTSGWTADWRASYGCHIDDSVPGVYGDHDGVLRQALPTDFSGGNYAWSQIVAVNPGAAYRFQTFYRLQDVGAAMLQLHFIYPNGDYMDYLNFRLSSPTLSGTQSEWSELTYDTTAPAGAAFVCVSLRLNSPGTVWWDRPVFWQTAPAPDISFVEDAQPYDLSDSVGIVVREMPVNMLAPLSALWLRYNINWASVQPDGPGSWDEVYFAEAIQEISAAKAAGINTMVSLGYPPRWAARQSEGISSAYLVAANQQDWQTYVAEVVSRLGSLTDTYRIMNEVNHQWDTGSQPEEYAEFLETACATIKSIRPNANVVMAGLSGTPGTFLQAMYNEGSGESFDTAACQPYVLGRKSPEDGHLAERLQSYRMVMAENRDDSPLWATEFGYASEPLDSITLEEQAGLYARSHLLALSSGSGVNKFFFYILRNQAGDTISQTGGLYTSDWQLRPVGTAVSTLAAVINPVRRYVGSVDMGTGPSVYNRLFEVDTNNHVWALWRTTGTSQLTRSFAHPVEQIRWDGQSLGSATSHVVSLSHLPVYLVGDMSDIASAAQKNIALNYDTIADDFNVITVPWVSEGQPSSNGPVLELTARRNPGFAQIALASVTASSEGLSLSVEIDDPSPALNPAPGYSGIANADSVELFVNLDEENAPAGYVTNDCYHFIASPGVGGNGACLYFAAQGYTPAQVQIDSEVTVTVRADGIGYTLAFLLPWSSFAPVAPQEGDIIGFDVMANVSGASATLEETGVWYGDIDNADDASLWGLIQLGDTEL